MIPDDIIDLVRESADIVQIISEHVPLKRQGTDYRGPCPFHQGTHRNFSVSPKKKIYYCFVCAAGGDVFNFVQKRLGMDWPSAVRLVAAKVGIDVPEERASSGPDAREPMWELNAAAAEYFTRTLWEDASGRVARSYLEQRGVSRALADKFLIGFAPREIGALRGYLSTLGYGDDRQVEAGLLVAREEGGEPRPRFRDRLIFPILDIGSHIVGFGGRLLAEGEPKYLNSAESAGFAKGRLLYGLSWAKQSVRRDERLILVEGYFDVLRLVETGIESVVAPLGTALTEAQASLVARYTKQVVLLYDSDTAGIKASFRAGDALLAQNVSVRVATLPDGEDPDTFARASGRAGVDALLRDAVDLFDRKIHVLERAGYFRDLDHKRRAIDRLLPTIRVTADPVTRDLYLGRLCEASGVSRAVLERELGAKARPVAEVRDRPSDVPPVVEGGGSAGPRRRPPERAPRTRHRGAGAERALVSAMLHARFKVEEIAERVGPDDFRTETYRDIYTALLSHGSGVTIEELAADLDEESVEIVQELLAIPESIVDLDRTIDDSVAHLRVRTFEQRLTEIDRELPLATDREKDALIQEKQRLGKEIGGLGAMGARFGKTER